MVFPFSLMFDTERIPLKEKKYSTESVWGPQLLNTGEGDLLLSPGLGVPVILSAKLGKHLIRSEPLRSVLAGDSELCGLRLPRPAPLSPPPGGPGVGGGGGGGPGCRHAQAGQLRPVSGDRLRTESGA